MKWSDTIERMMLIKVVEQNPGLKFDADKALESWPDELDAPTKRGLGDRFATIKRQLRDGGVSISVGSTQTMTPSSTTARTAKSVPKTPRPIKKSKESTGIKIKPDPDVKYETDVDLDAAPGTGSLNPITHAAGASTTAFKSRLTGKPSRNAVYGTKRKRTGKGKANGAFTIDSEASMSDNNSDSETPADLSPSEVARAASEGRRSLPRRSKSMTPATYSVDIETEEDENQSTSETEVGSDAESAKNKHESKKTKANGVNHRRSAQGDSSEGDDEEGSDGSFDPIADREMKNGSGMKAKKQKLGWAERVALMDEHDEDSMMD